MALVGVVSPLFGCTTAAPGITNVNVSSRDGSDNPVHARASAHNGTRPIVAQMGAYLVLLNPQRPKHARRVVRIGDLDSVAVAATKRNVYWIAPTTHRNNVIESADLRSGKTHMVVSKAGYSANAMVISRHFLYWGQSGSIGRLSLKTGKVLARYLVLPKVATGNIEDGLAAAGHFLYLSQCVKGRIGRINTLARTPRRSLSWVVHTNSCPQALSVANGSVYWTGSMGPGSEGFVGRQVLKGGRADGTWIGTHSNRGPLFVVANSHFIYWQTEGARDAFYLGKGTPGGRYLDSRFLRIGPSAIAPQGR
jgi:hypothetical protein